MWNFKMLVTMMYFTNDGKSQESRVLHFTERRTANTTGGLQVQTEQQTTDLRALEVRSYRMPLANAPQSASL